MVHEAQIAHLRAEVARLNEALRQAETVGAPPKAVSVPVQEPEPEMQTAPGTATAVDGLATEVHERPADPAVLGPPSAVVGAGISEPTQLRAAQPKRQPGEAGAAGGGDDATAGAQAPRAREIDAE